MMTTTSGPKAFQPGERVFVLFADGTRKLAIVECACPGRYLVSFAPAKLLWVAADYVSAA